MPTYGALLKSPFSFRICWLFLAVLATESVFSPISLTDVGYHFVLYFFGFEPLNNLIKTGAQFLFANIADILTSVWFLLGSYFLYALHTCRTRGILFPSLSFKLVPIAIKTSLLVTWLGLIGGSLFLLLIAINLWGLYGKYKTELMPMFLSFTRIDSFTSFFQMVQALPNHIKQLYQLYQNFSIKTWIREISYLCMPLGILTYFFYGLGLLYSFTQKFKVFSCFHILRHIRFFIRYAKGLIGPHFFLLFLWMGYKILVWLIPSIWIQKGLLTYCLGVTLATFGAIFRAIDEVNTPNSPVQNI